MLDTNKPMTTGSAVVTREDQIASVLTRMGNLTHGGSVPFIVRCAGQTRIFAPDTCTDDELKALVDGTRSLAAAVAANSIPECI